MMDLDTHTDNTVLGGSCLLIHDTGRKVDVSGFSSALGLIELPIISGAVAYDHPITCKVYILVFHQMIYCWQMENHLICPMQCRVNGVVINDTPKMCVPNPNDSTHSIEVTDPLDPDATLHIPLMLRGVTSCFCVRKPSTAEFADDDIPKLDMTYQSPEWDPGDPDWATQEASTMNSRRRVYDLDNVIAGGRRFINLVSTSEQSTDFTADDYFHGALQAETVAVRSATKCSQINGWSHQRLLVAPWKEPHSGGCGRFPTHLFLFVFEQTIDNSATSAFDMMCLLTRCS
jgi:hypothetical protein